MNDLVLRTAQESGFTATAVELIRNTAAKGCSDEEVAQLLIIAHRTGLDPLARQVYMIQRWDSRASRNVATPQTSIDGYRLVADRTNKYVPGRAPTLEYDENGSLYSATAYIKKLAGGEWHEIPATAYWDEYAQRNKSGNLTPLWEKMPRLMLAKCAEALALRKAFPAELSGLYTAEEMAQADTPVVTVMAPQKIDAPQAQTVELIAPAQLDRLNTLGKAVYGDDWESKRAVLAMAASREMTADPKELTTKEAGWLVKGLEEKAKELADQADKAEAAQLDPMELAI